MEEKLFVTVENVRKENGTLIMETIDPSRDSDLVSGEDGLQRRDSMMTDEQENVTELHNSA